MAAGYSLVAERSDSVDVVVVQELVVIIIIVIIIVFVVVVVVVFVKVVSFVDNTFFKFSDREEKQAGQCWV